MKTRQEDTEQRIINTALAIFFTQGIKRTSMDDIAIEAGLTRVTVYRYFDDKKELVREVFKHVVQIIENTIDEMGNGPDGKVEDVLDCLWNGIAVLPKGNLPERTDELRRIYPDVWEEFTAAHRQAIETIFKRIMTSAELQGRLRSSLNQEVLLAYFMNAVLNVIQNPDMVLRGPTREEIYSNVKQIFLYGILAN